jgi:hypothetical protein
MAESPSTPRPTTPRASTPRAESSRTGLYGAAKKSARRAEELHRAKGQRAVRERELQHIKNRVKHLANEAQKVRAQIAKTNERVRDTLAVRERSAMYRRVQAETKGWIGEELEYRREVINEQRREGKEAMRRERLAVLEAKHAECDGRHYARVRDRPRCADGGGRVPAGTSR